MKRSITILCMTKPEREVIEVGTRAHTQFAYENDGPPSASIAYIKELAR